MYLANKVQNIKGSADVLLECAGLTFDELRPIADAMERGGRKAAAKSGDGRHPAQSLCHRRHSGRMHTAHRRISRRGLHPHHAGNLGRRSHGTGEVIRRRRAAAFQEIGSTSSIFACGRLTCPTLLSRPQSHETRHRSVVRASRWLASLRRQEWARVRHLAIVDAQFLGFQINAVQSALLSKHDGPRALTSSEEYGSMASGMWNWLATAPLSRMKRFSPTSGFQASSV